MTRKTILIVDDHFVVRDGLRLILETSKEYQVIAEAENGYDAVKAVDEYHPNLILMDLNLPGLTGLEAIEIIRQKHSDIPIIILTAFNEDSSILRGLQLGAKGYLLKDTDRESFFRAIESALRGETLLSPEISKKIFSYKDKREQENLLKNSFALSKKEYLILQQVARGFTNKEIAFDLGLSERTIKAHLTNIYNKLGVNSRSEAVATALDKGLISL
ncbi:response regulator transcription factor [Bacillus inaquosorum]|uniref:response regulator transcription factor n=1 Tax=Bacillus inaquosorum TaxID=483913 RepID=UPI0022817C46|nr:response regulator transcription factor [Bacillus inaquosorum]MCY8855549.1 response regulator transcription factor [Bacillus inaquosorum]MCY9010805.1 response regulator transcription factor [Bacillus inaquosorum]MCY9030758.1 response regulator transcription factor [Bacillus inaquosorum]MCY9036531.1 response regulator transcription factor [Bacillus inaquosorum]MCY9045866.1 response regulator transcription factor [Bacillus inaquosorum]